MSNIVQIKPGLHMNSCKYTCSRTTSFFVYEDKRFFGNTKACIFLVLFLTDETYPKCYIPQA